ncbi:MAG: DUF4350 domain-containing protein [Sandaracinaceae bacterium]|nr:DUF4350 domain-containing protein [Sandaracinaceae bacterium]
MKRWLSRITIGALVMLVAGAGAVMCQRVGARGRYVAAYSTYGAGPEGTRGLYLLAERLGAHPQRWSEDLARLPPRAMLVALGSCDQLVSRPLTRIERDYLVEWVRRGGVLVVAGSTDYLEESAFGVSLQGDDARCAPAAGLLGMLARADRRRQEGGDAGTDELDRLPEDFREDPGGTYDEVVEEDELPIAEWAEPSAGPLAGLPFLGMRRALDVRLKSGAEAQTLLTIDGEPAAVRVTHGEGSVIVLASASPFQNRDIEEHVGGPLFARLVRAYAPEGPVLFDEYHLGVGERRSIMKYLRQTGLGPLVLQLMLLIGIALWRPGARFGGVRTAPPPDPAGTVSYVEGVGTLYQKSKDPAGAAAIVAKRAIAEIAAHHHLSSSEPHALADALERRKRPDAAEAVRKLASLSAGARDLARAIVEIDALRERACAEARR